MRISSKIPFLLLIIISFVQNSGAQTPAFPTAEGYGKWATGGRGGKVVEVTTVEDDGVGNLVGSFRWALKQHSGEPITIVFRVSGIIDLKGVELRSKRNNITIAGQTAPGDGICFKGESINFGGSYNLILRNLRFRTGAYTSAGAEVNAACFILENGGNFIIDHCTFSWSSEELCDIADDINWTTQWCIFSEGLYNSINSKGARGYGPVIIGQGASFHHNLLSSNVSRSPRFGVTTDVIRNVLIDYVNNVNYNYGKSNSCYGGENEKGKFGTEKINFVNNYYKQGPAYPNTNSSKFIRASYEIGLQDTFYTKWHMSGNYIEGTVNVNLNTNNYAGLDFQDYSAQLPACTINNLKSDHHTIEFPIETQSPQDAFELIMNKSGAIPRDTIDRRIIREATNGVATFHGIFNNNKLSGIIDKPEDAEGWPEYKTYNTIVDNDHDGMDDTWETANGLNTNDSNDRNNVTLSGYTALEVYLNSLMGESIDLKFDTSTKGVLKISDFDLKIIDKNLFIYTSTDIFKLSLYDVSGRMCFNQTRLENGNSINISSFNKGIYIIRLQTRDNHTFYHKISI